MKYPMIVSCLFLTMMVFSGCDPEPTDPCENDTPDHDTKLSAKYLNTSSAGPTLTIDPTASSSKINIANVPTIVPLGNGRIDLLYSGVTFKEGKTVYVVDNVVSQRKADCWIVDVENEMRFSLSKSLDIVLVLDVSSSLGNNISAVKSNAKKMVTDILNSNPDARIAIVKFSRGSVVQGFTSVASTLNQFIDNNSIFNDPSIGSYQLEGRSETALYESINDAIVLLNNSGADGTGILTFTDGVSNFQFDPQFQDELEIIDSLNASGISHYTIGFEGNQNSVDESVLERLAVNGNFSFPKDLTELEEVFTRFSNSVAAVYDLYYNTNDALLENPVEYRFLFNATIVSE